jgi:hypothetical protein
LNNATSNIATSAFLCCALNLPKCFCTHDLISFSQRHRVNRIRDRLIMMRAEHPGWARTWHAGDGHRIGAALQ